MRRPTRSWTPTLTRLLGVVASVLIVSSTPRLAESACNTIPEEPVAFRGAVGTVDRPFARAGQGPGDYLRAGRGCGSPALADHDGDGSIDAEDYVVTVVFTPPGSGARNIVALTAGSDCGACSGKGEVHCVPGTDGILVNTSLETVAFRFPGTDDHPAAPEGEGRPFTGPATVAVSPAGAPLPCELRTQRCADYGGSTSLFACVDELYRAGSCGTDRSDLDPTFAHFTALPPANVYAKLCHDSGPDQPPCNDQAPELRFAVDKAGNAAVPVRWTEILRDKPGSPNRKDNRRVQGSTGAPASAGASAPIHVPSEVFLASFTPFGTGFTPAPRFEPRLLPATAQRPFELGLSGEADEEESTLWFARRKLWLYQCDAQGSAPGQACEPGTAAQDCPGTPSCQQRATAAYFACSGGARDGLPCTRRAHCPQGSCSAGSICLESGTPVSPQKACLTDLDCDPGAECGQGLFEFRDQLVGGVGPVVLPKQSAPGPGRVCRGGPDDGKPCTATCTCVGFRASADGYNPKP
jgi:hypothetical protein